MFEKAQQISQYYKSEKGNDRGHSTDSISKSTLSGKVKCRYSGVTLKRAKAYCRFVLRQNQIPMAPHLLYPQFMDDKDRGRIYTINEVILNKCTELWVFGDRRSPGMKKEIAYAKSKLKKIRYVTVKERA